jgi:hypothetical protein
MVNKLPFGNLPEFGEKHKFTNPRSTSYYKEVKYNKTIPKYFFRD